MLSVIVAKIKKSSAAESWVLLCTSSSIFSVALLNCTDGNGSRHEFVGTLLDHQSI